MKDIYDNIYLHEPEQFNKTDKGKLTER